MSIIISQDGKNAQRKDKLLFENEDYMQNYIHENPEVVPVYEISEDKRLFVAAREFRTEAGPIDALAFDQDGDIYIIETKLQKNYTRRDVVAQALDYGASLWRHSNPINFIVQLNDVASQSFEERLKEFFNLDEEQAHIVIEAIKSNLQAGNIKFVIMMDLIEDRLKDLIVYINQTSQFDIYAVQMEYYKHEQFEIIIPKMFGVEVKKNTSGNSNGNIRRVWNEESFISQTKENLGSEAEKVIKLYDYLKSNTDKIKIKWGTGNIRGSFAPIIKKLSPTISPFSIYSDGTFAIKFNWLKNHVETEVFEKYFRVFVSEVEKNKVKLSLDELLQDASKPSIESREFIENYEGIFKTIKAVINI